MGTLERRLVTHLFIRQGLRLHQIQTEPSDVYHEPALRLPAAEKWRLRVADRTSSLEDEPKSTRPRKTDIAAQLPSCFARSHSLPARRYVDD
jgi:hypothetical protein